LFIINILSMYVLLFY